MLSDAHFQFWFQSQSRENQELIKEYCHVCKDTFEKAMDFMLAEMVTGKKVNDFGIDFVPMHKNKKMITFGIRSNGMIK